MAKDLKSSGYHYSTTWQNAVMDLPVNMTKEMLELIKLGGEIKEVALAMPYQLDNTKESIEQIITVSIATAAQIADINVYLNGVSIEDLKKEAEKLQLSAKTKPQVLQDLTACKEQLDITTDLQNRR